MKIYTKTGDKGETGLYGGNRIPKNSLRIEAIGTVDELNSVLGVVLASVKNKKVAKEITAIKNDLFDIGAYLATPKDTQVDKGKELLQTFPPYLTKRTKELEDAIDFYSKDLPILRNFILSGGGQSGSFLHLARSVSRRAERRVITFSKKELVSEAVLQYMNRLSDLLFTLARFVNLKEKKEEIYWQSFTKKEKK